MKYRKKPATVEAFQITRQTRADNSEWPEWLHEAWQKGYEVNSVHCVDYPDSDGTDRLEVITDDGPVVVQWSDWIMKNEDGDLEVWTDTAFHKIHEPA